MKIERLIGIVMILLQQEKITAPELAKRFEVSRRTINRDIEDICRAGIPLITTQGHEGGISIADNYKVNKTFFTQEELQAVLTGLKGIDSISQIPYSATMREKLSEKGSHIVADDVIMIDLASHYYDSLSEKIAQIKSAILERHTISFQYFYKKGESIRHIEPYRLVFKWSSWYVFGYCFDREGFRLFKLNRLIGLRKLDDTFTLRTLPEDALNFDRYFSSDKIFHLKALFSVSEKYRLIEEYGAGCYLESANKLVFEQDFVSYENMREWVFSFGDKVEVLEPKQLVKDRLVQAENIIVQVRTTI